MPPFVSDSTLSLTNVTTICPECDGEAVIQDGTYEFIGNVLAAFTAPGMTREKVEAARKVAEEAASGMVSSEEAIHLLRDISATLARAVSQPPPSVKINWELVIAIFALLQSFWGSYSSDADVQAALAEARKQTELSQKILEELQKQSAIDGMTRPTKVRPKLDPTQMTTPKNRAERRKAAAIERRKKGRAG